MAVLLGPIGCAAVNNPLRILRTLDRHLTASAELTLFGRAALALGFPTSPVAYEATQHVDAILPIAWLNAPDANLDFWQAQQRTNTELEPEGLYMTHLFREFEVILTADWVLRRISIKWQIICPVIALLFVAIWAGLQQRHNQGKAIEAAIERHLGSVLSELESLQDLGRFPSIQAAKRALNDEAVANKVHITSLFGTGELFYNPSQPTIGGATLILCARIRNALVAIQADRKVRKLSENELRQAGLVPLFDGSTETLARPSAERTAARID